MNTIKKLSFKKLSFDIDTLHDALRLNGKVSATLQQGVLEVMQAGNQQLFVDYATKYEPNPKDYDEKDALDTARSVFNADMSNLRKRIRAACKVMELPTMTVKKPKGMDWQWIAATKQQGNKRSKSGNGTKSKKSDLVKMVENFERTRDHDEAAQIIALLSKMVKGEV